MWKMTNDRYSDISITETTQNAGIFISFLSSLVKKCLGFIYLTHWGRVMHICIGNLSIIGSDNGLSPSRLQAIIWTNAGILSIWPLGTNFSEI